ncbi:DUF3078 domain-containing protein [Rubrivirga sp.]|uniref:DUF3078 domain-containing protein n=1 Tax=Rubrivirga sp. TaxID=1885344 RepID=UPI003C7191F8
MRIVILALALSWASGALAQEPDTLAAEDGWRSDLVLAVNGNQSSFSNWQEGGVDALAVTSSLDGSFDRVIGRVLTTQTLRLALGALRQDTLDIRKALDIARYDVTAERTGGPLRPAVAASFRTQFAAGFDYSPTADEYPTLEVVSGQELKVSDALAPLVMSQSVGLAYRPGGGFVGRAGLGVKETFVRIERLRPLYGNDPDQALRVEAGLDVELALEQELMENVVLRSRLSSFQAFNQVASDAPDVLFENVLLLKVNDVLNVSLDGAVLYDADVSPDAQFRQALSIGMAFGIL